MISVLLALPALLAAGAIDVRSTTDCPSGTEVLARLRPLLPQASETTEAAHVAQIDPAESRTDGVADLRLRLLRRDGHVIGDRRVSLQGSCEEVADSVAAIIATWETAPMAGSLGSTGSPIPSPAAPADQSPSFQLSVGAGAGVALIGGVAAAGNVEIRLGRAFSHWQLRLGMATETDRQLDLSPGHVDFGHTTVALGLALRSLHPSWQISADAGPLAGWVTVAGSGYSPNRQKRSFEYGVGAGLRATFWFGRVGLWAESRASLWVEGQQARVTGADSSRDLPLVDVAASLGLSLWVFK